MAHVYIETKPNTYTTPYVSVTIHTKTKNCKNIDIENLKWKIEGMVRELNKD